MKLVMNLAVSLLINSCGSFSNNQKAYTTKHYFFRELYLTFFHRFSAAYYDFVLSFFPARQVSEIILNEFELLQIDTTKYFLKSKVYVVSLVISAVSKTGFEIFLAHLVCLKSEK
jgi:hypothetical protein